MSFQDFQRAPNKLTSSDIGFLILTGVVIILAASALAVVGYYLATFLPDGGEFYLLRAGGRSFLFDHIEPYSGDVPAGVQEQVYGRPALPGEDAYILDIPFHLLMVFFPLALFPDALIARAFWVALSLPALFGMIALSFRLLNRKVSWFFGTVIFVACASSFYAYRSLLEGSPAILLSLAYVGIFLSLRAGLDELTGALIALSSFQWEMGGLFLLFILLWVFWERRWRVFIGGAMLSFILLAISLFTYPGWILPFLRAAWNSFRAGFGYSSHVILLQLWPDYGSTLAWVMTAALIMLLGYEWMSTRGANFQRLIWAVCVTFAMTPLLGFRVELDQLVPLVLPVMLLVIISRERWQKIGYGIAFILVLFFFGTPWLLFTRGVPEGIDLRVDEVLFLFWPLFSLIGLYWMRWWIVRPPRTWLDQIGK